MSRSDGPATVRERVKREDIVEGALRVARSEGLGAITMRRLAAELGTSPMAFYWHVRNKDEVLALLADDVLGKVAPADQNPKRWAEELTRLGRETFHAMAGVPGLAAWVLAQSPLLATPSALRLADSAMALLLAAGFDEETAVPAFMTLYTIVAGQALLQERPDGNMERGLDALASGDYPALARLATHLNRLGDEAYLDYGLRIHVDGLRRELTKARRSRTS